MSAYLQRLVSHVQSPPAGVRPVVRPLFAAPADRFELAAEPFAPPPAQAPGAVGRTATTTPAPHVESAQAASPPPLLLPQVPVESAETASRAPAVTPLMRRSEPSSPERAEPSAAPPPPASDEATHTSSFVHTLQVSRETIVQQLMPPVATQARVPAAIPAPASPPPVDDIQIHIGRIEIHAVPPAPAPRAAPSKVRHGVNLDEYLTRDRGRTR